jgi:hypothetical protein
LGARSFRRARPTSIALVQMPVTCHRITVVGKWRPNDSFKGKPLRGFRASMMMRGRLPLIQVLGPMSTLSKAIVLSVAFGLGVICSFISAMLYVAATYRCTPGPLEPCDAGAYAGFGLALLLSPFLGAIFVYDTNRWLVMRSRSRHEA